MMPPTLLLFTLSAMIISCKGECPAMNDIPVMFNDQAFTCGKKWMDWGGDYAVDSCNGNPYTFPDGYDDDAYGGAFYPMGSIFVKPGCTMYMYEENGYSGESHVISGPAEVYRNTHWNLNHHSPAGPSSFKCRCIQKKVDCEPEDSLEVVLWCDNRNSVVETKCTYEKTIGTEFSNELSIGMHIDATIEAELSFQFWKIFEARLGISVNTGMDWGDVNTVTKSEQTTITIESTVPPGIVLVVEQTVGHCGGSEVRTDMFKTSTQDKDGNVVSQRVLDNETFMKEVHAAKDNLIKIL